MVSHPAPNFIVFAKIHNLCLLVCCRWVVFLSVVIPKLLAFDIVFIPYSHVHDFIWMCKFFIEKYLMSMHMRICEIVFIVCVWLDESLFYQITKTGFSLGSSERYFCMKGSLINTKHLCLYSSCSGSSSSFIRSWLVQRHCGLALSEKPGALWEIQLPTKVTLSDMWPPL